MLKRILLLYNRIVRALVFGLAVISGAAILLMIAVTCTDIIMRIWGSALPGSYDIIRVSSIVAISFGLSYTSAVKGHVAIEFFFQKLSGRARVVFDTLIRLISFALFVIMGLRCIQYGLDLHASGQVTDSLKIPLFWLPFCLAFNFFVLALVFVDSIMHPGKETIKP